MRGRILRDLRFHEGGDEVVARKGDHVDLLTLDDLAKSDEKDERVFGEQLRKRRYAGALMRWNGKARMATLGSDVVVDDNERRAEVPVMADGPRTGELPAWARR